MTTKLQESRIKRLLVRGHPVSCNHYRKDTDMCTVGCHDSRVSVNAGDPCPFDIEDQVECSNYK